MVLLLFRCLFWQGFCVVVFAVPALKSMDLALSLKRKVSQNARFITYMKKANHTFTGKTADSYLYFTLNIRIIRAWIKPKQFAIMMGGSFIKIP